MCMEGLYLTDEGNAKVVRFSVQRVVHPMYAQSVDSPVPATARSGSSLTWSLASARAATLPDLSAMTSGVLTAPLASLQSRT